VANDDTVSLHELVLANNIELDALVKVLVDKGLITENELRDAIREMKRQIVGEGRPGSA
jgi:polyhydroxyalkanoate synthesis regulator phasin